MGRRLNTSTTTVIQTELRPLTDNFELIPNGQTEQWYHVNTNVFAPDRQLKPLVIAPKVSALDEETSITYAPILDTTEWYAQEWNGTAYVETRIINHEEGFQYDYIITDAGLKVNKNISDASHGVQIRCVGQYIDPRDGGIRYEVEQTIKLTTNRDAEVVYPKIDVLAPSTQMYNPLVDASSQFSLKAKADWTGVPKSSEFIVDYAVDPKGTEAIIPDNESALVTSAPTMDIRYGKGSGSVLKENQQFMYRQVSGGTVSPIGSNLAYIEKIKGNTVKFNQLVTPAIIGTSVPSNWQRGTNTTVSVSNKELTLYSTDGSSTSNVFIAIPIKNTNGHKYYMKMSIKSDTTGASIAAIFNNTQSLFDKQTTTSYKDIGGIVTSQASSVYVNIFVDPRNASAKYKIKSVNVYDLTDLGIASLTTIEDIEAWLEVNLGKFYYPYNAGELIPVKMSAIKSVGFNLWDEQWELGVYSTYTNNGSGEKETDATHIRSKNYIKVTPNSTYYVKSTNNVRLGYYDINKKWLGNTQDVGVKSGKNITFTVPSNVYFIAFYVDVTGITTYNHDICINLSDASRNGTYEAHWEAEQYLPITELKGKVNGTGDSVTIFPDGMNYLSSTLVDEIFVDTGVIKADRKCGMVNLGELEWSMRSSNGHYCFISKSLRGTQFAEKYQSANQLNGKGYTTARDTYLIADYIDGSYNKCITLGGTFYEGSGSYIGIADDSYTTEQEFKTAMNGVYLVYELATPIEYIIDNMPRGQFEWYGVKNGTEVKIDTLPCYVSGQHTDTIVVDAMYSEDMSVILRLKETAASSNPMPMKVYKNIVWRIPPLSSHVMSKNGGAVRSDSGEFEFTTIVNSTKTLLSEEVVKTHLRFNWRMHRTNTAVYTNKGWGYNMIATKQELINVRGANNSLSSTHVDNDVYLLGAYEAVTYDNEELTYNGTPLYGRSLG